jgi:hypothetical protein
MTRTWSRSLAGLALTAGLLAAISASPAGAATAGRARVAVYESPGGTGYVEHHNKVTYTSVSAQWIQPTVSCPVPGAQVDLLVGLDGFANGFYEQTGTQVKCPNGTPVYSGWAALYPKRAVVFTSTLLPGDQITASVTESSTQLGVYTTVLTDVTQGWTQGISRFVAFPIGQSAEVTLDDPYPAGRHGPAPLADFGTAGFTNVMANGRDMIDPTRIVMVRNSGTGLKASVTALLGHTHFSTTWLNAS